MAGPFLAAPLILKTKSRKKSKQLFSVETPPNLVPSTRRQAQHMPASPMVGRSVWFVVLVAGFFVWFFFLCVWGWGGWRKCRVSERSVVFWRENVLFSFERRYFVGDDA